MNNATTVRIKPSTLKELNILKHNKEFKTHDLLIQHLIYQDQLKQTKKVKP